MKKTDNTLVKIVFAAALAALTCVATMIIRVPTIATNGYVNVGDAVVLISAWLLGNPFGALAAGIGSGLADLLAGYGSYVPGTAIIKFAMAFVAWLIFKGFNKEGAKAAIKTVGYIVSAIVAELIMIGGYFAYESTILGYGLGAAGSIISNAVQAVTCAVLGVAAIHALNGVGYINKAVKKKMQG